MKTIVENNVIAGYSVTGLGNCRTSLVKIPSAYHNLPVLAIADEAFKECQTIKNVVIPDSVLTIGNGAFYNCLELIRVEVGKGVCAIGDNCFKYCFNLKNINLNPSVYIGEAAFWDCQSLSLPTLELNSQTVNDYAFTACGYLGKVILGEQTQTIGVAAFADCYNLKSVTISSSVTYIKHGAFSKCIGLKDIYYSGTKNQWASILKETGYYDDGTIASWDAYITDYTIHCNDGDIAFTPAE